MSLRRGLIPGILLASLLFCVCDKSDETPTPMTQAELAADLASLGPWPMGGQNPQRTSCSPYIGPTTPTVKWQVHLPHKTGSSRTSYAGGPLVAVDGTVLICVNKESLVAVSFEGEELWATPVARTRYAPLMFNANTVLVANDSIATVDLTSGKRKKLYDKGFSLTYQIKLETYFSIPLRINPNLVVFFQLDEQRATVNLQGIMNEQYSLLALDSEGEEVWEIDMAMFSMWPMVLWHTNQLTYGEMFGDIRTIDLDGNEVWNCTPQVQGYPDSLLAVSPDNLLLCGQKNRPFLTCLDETGAQVWAHDFSPMRIERIGIDPFGNVLLAMNEVFMTSGPRPDSKVVKLDPAGQLLWECDYFETPVWFLTIDSTGNTYCTMEDGMRAFSPVGEELWFLPLPGITQQAAIGEDGTLYVLSHDGTLYAVGEAVE